LFYLLNVEPFCIALGNTPRLKLHDSVVE
jgi:hypothetical protein